MINRDTQLCMSLAGRPGNFGTRFHNYLYEKLGFREWGREPHAFKLKDGSYRDEIQMVLFLS